jgi:hypothetical protein
MMVQPTLLLCGLCSLVFGAESQPVLFSDQFKDSYPEIIDASAGSWDGLPQEAAIAVPSPHRAWTATLRRTDGAQVPYDRSLARIEVAGEGGPLVVIQAHGFRTVTVTWINDRLLRVVLGLGRVAEVDAIYDLESRRWVYQDSVSYPPPR